MNAPAADLDDIEYVRAQLMNARAKAQHYKKQRDTWRAECLKRRKARAPTDSFVSAADALAAVASALPDVVKTKALQQSLSEYRKARKAQ